MITTPSVTDNIIDNMDIGTKSIISLAGQYIGIKTQEEDPFSMWVSLQENLSLGNPTCSVTETNRMLNILLHCI